MSEIDLHTHSSASDGSLTPAALVRAGKAAGLRALALTDHDTTSGLFEAVSTGKQLGIEIIPGCELSVQSAQGHMHLVGLWLPLGPHRLQAKLAWLQKKRQERNQHILTALASLGIAIDPEEVKAVAGGESIGRPHIAQVLVRKKIVSSLDQAFQTLIGPTGPAYVPKTKLTPEEAIAIFKQEQATVILAHPFSLQMAPEALRQEMGRLQTLGLDGLEAIYPEHTPEQTTFFTQLCSDFGLLVSGGSDFHGDIKPDISLGRGRGDLNLPYTLLDTMKARRRQQGLPCGDHS